MHYFRNDLGHLVSMPDNLWMAFQKHNPKAKEVIFEVEPVRVDPVKIEPVKVEIKPLNEPVRIEPPKMEVKPEPKKVEPKVEPEIEALQVDSIVSKGKADFNQLEKLKEEKIENTRVKRRRTAPRKHR